MHGYQHLFTDTHSCHALSQRPQERGVMNAAWDSKMIYCYQVMGHQQHVIFSRNAICLNTAKVKHFKISQICTTQSETPRRSKTPKFFKQYRPGFLQGGPPEVVNLGYKQGNNHLWYIWTSLLSGLSYVFGSSTALRFPNISFVTSAW